jgi:hypothetical protein
MCQSTRFYSRLGPWRARNSYRSSQQATPHGLGTRLHLLYQYINFASHQRVFLTGKRGAANPLEMEAPVETQLLTCRLYALEFLKGTSYLFPGMGIICGVAPAVHMTVTTVTKAYTGKAQSVLSGTMRVITSSSCIKLCILTTMRFIHDSKTTLGCVMRH